MNARIERFLIALMFALLAAATLLGTSQEGVGSRLRCGRRAVGTSGRIDRQSAGRYRRYVTRWYDRPLAVRLGRTIDGFGRRRFRRLSRAEVKNDR